jgi:hypothetical protein
MASSTKKFIAASGLALGLATFGMSVSAGTAIADGTKPDTGSYDETFRVDKSPVQQTLTGSYDVLLNILDPDGFQAARP